MILVVGATGDVGGSVARALAARGERVRVLVRAGANYGELTQLGAEAVQGDLKDASSLARAVAGVRTVITTANTARRGGDDNVETVDRQGNARLIEAAAAAGVEHFIFTSALGMSEDSPVDFFRAKAESERRLRESGMRYTIMQPNMFMDVWIGALVLLPVSQGNPITLVGRGDHRHTLVATRDVAAYLVGAVSNPAAHDRSIPITGPDAVSFSDVVRIAERVLGRSLEVRYIAPGEPVPGLPTVVSGMAAAFETYEMLLDTSETAAEFGVRQTSVEEYLTKALVPPQPAA